ncbi:hypothetical protein NHE_0496 [Neorickettsia helminthoeca str. Oregon]|uniref:Uncharacterized protein n=1 Tax=Neorickettsia helminthoeca str. Oregon TaxID=1286528 RepID=X5H427_9RICK|nr:hypothetical protein NHE_0496 [Neorickettsia helminthoeca str. Oregon]
MMKFLLEAPDRNITPKSLERQDERYLSPYQSSQVEVF